MSGAMRRKIRVRSGDGGDDVKHGGLTMVSPSNMVVKTCKKPSKNRGGWGTPSNSVG
jgi:hypothetical protein